MAIVDYGDGYFETNNDYNLFQPRSFRLNDRTLVKRQFGKELVSSAIYDDDLVMGYIHNFPKQIGHVLIVPLKVTKSYRDIPEETAARMMVVAQKIGQVLVNMGAEGTNLLMNDGEAASEIDAPYAHLYVIPRYPKDGLRFKFGSTELNRSELEQVAESIKEQLSSTHEVDI